MSKKKSAKPETEANATVDFDRDLLATIVAATLAENFVYTNVMQNGPLLAAGVIEVNEQLTNDAGEVATRATAKGIETMNATATPETEVQTEQAPQIAVGKPRFAIEDSIPVPTAKRGVGAGLYPFDDLKPGQSFFVPATTDKPTPAKSLASTVSSATKRYSETEEKRVFVVRSVEGGARVWRTA